MANDITAFFERLTAASEEYNAAVVGTLAALPNVYLDLKPEAARNGQTIRIPYPDVGAFTDQQANDWTLEDEVPAYVDVTLGQRPAKGIIIRSFEMTLTSSELIKAYIDPMAKRAMEYANGQIFAQLNTTNFNAYGPINTVNPAQISIGDARTCWNVLTRNKVPLDRDNAAILYHPDIHANTLTDSNWYQESLVGAVLAQDTRQNVAMQEGNVAFRFRRAYDQQAPTGTAAVTGTLALTNGSNAVVGTGTAFTQSMVGSWITAPDTKQYQIATFTDATHITLGQAYAGTTNATATVTRVTYTSVAMHKYAMVLVVRPLPLDNGPQVASRLMNLAGLPVRAQVSYQHLKDGYMFTMDYVMVAKVVRPTFGIIINS
jgi:hypothetical protein